MVALWQRKKRKNRLIEKTTACVDKRLWTASWGWSHKVLREYSFHRWEVAVHKKVLLKRLGLECSHKCTLSDQRALRSGDAWCCSVVSASAVAGLRVAKCHRPGRCICKSEFVGIRIRSEAVLNVIWLMLQKALQLACCLIGVHVA